MRLIQIRIPDVDKEAVEKILEFLGIDLPTAIRMYLKKIIRSKSIPFSLRADEDHFTEAEIEEILRREKEADQGKNISPEFSSAKEAIQYLDNDICLKEKLSTTKNSRKASPDSVRRRK
ncbi:type II toxin-antitoxin system RelB/DinJ family antitoxin [Candidatus Peregrinibacteria bacterium]|nr:type II toxin-antitoxin system RelB/DinJ family antitoxin [Candidatus Peregrinibacteria bacterium]